MDSAHHQFFFWPSEFSNAWFDGPRSSLGPAEPPRRKLDGSLDFGIVFANAACRPSLDHFQRRVAGGIAEAAAIGMDDDIVEIRIVEGNSSALVGGVVELPTTTAITAL